MIAYNLSDSELVALYIGGEELALERLILKHKDKIYRFIYSKVGDKILSDDIFQDTFIKVIKTLKANKYNEEGKFLSWVMRIAHNLVIDYFRKESRMPKYNNRDEFDIFSVIKDDVMNIEGVMMKNQTERDVRKAIERLPNEQKEVLKMRYYDDLSFKAISKITGVSINTSLGRMRYALINLKKIINSNHAIA